MRLVNLVLLNHQINSSDEITTSSLPIQTHCFIWLNGCAIVVLAGCGFEAVELLIVFHYQNRWFQSSRWKSMNWLAKPVAFSCQTIHYQVLNQCFRINQLYHPVFTQTKIRYNQRLRGAICNYVFVCFKKDIEANKNIVCNNCPFLHTSLSSSFWCSISCMESLKSPRIYFDDTKKRFRLPFS